MQTLRGIRALRRAHLSAIIVLRRSLTVIVERAVPHVGSYRPTVRTVVDGQSR